MARTTQPRRVDRAARYGPWIFLAILLTITGLCGAAIGQYVSNHWPGVPMQQATVVRCRPLVVNEVCATTADGAKAAFSYGGHVFTPRVGSSIAVFDKDGAWHARDEVGLPIWPLVLGLICAAGSLALIVLLVRRLRRWLRDRRPEHP